MQARFREKSIYVKLTFFVAQNIKFGTKLMPYPESMAKIQLKSRWVVFEICLCQQLLAFKEFSMEKRLHNISKSTNATDLTKTIQKAIVIYFRKFY